MRAVRAAVMAALTIFIHAASSLSSQAPPIPQETIGKQLGDYTLTDQDGKTFNLNEFRGKPYVISLIYASCGHICPTITMHLAAAVKEAGKGPGERFKVITVSFDPENDTTARMKEYGKNFTSSFDNWKFASADATTISRLAGDLGFYYKKIDGGFDHMNMVTIVDAKGKIFKHVYGLDFKPQAILDPSARSLAGLGAGSEQDVGLMKKIILFCYKYDEATGAYILDYGHISLIASGLVFQLGLVFLMAYVGYAIRKTSRQQQA